MDWEGQRVRALQESQLLWAFKRWAAMTRAERRHRFVHPRPDDRGRALARIHERIEAAEQAAASPEERASGLFPGRAFTAAMRARYRACAQFERSRPAPLLAELLAELLAVDLEAGPPPDEDDDVDPMVDQLVGPLVSARSAPPRPRVALVAT